MKYLLIICLLILSPSCKQNSNIIKKDSVMDSNVFIDKYQNIAGKHIKSVEVQDLLKRLGSEYKYTNHEIVKFYDYDSKGVQLNFNENDTLNVIFFDVNKIDSQIILPYGITASSTKGEIENRLGKPDKYSVSTNLSAEYFDKNLLIKYQSSDSVNLNNKIVYLGIKK